MRGCLVRMQINYPHHFVRTHTGHFQHDTTVPGKRQESFCHRQQSCVSPRCSLYDTTKNQALACFINQANFLSDLLTGQSRDVNERGWNLRVQTLASKPRNSSTLPFISAFPALTLSRSGRLVFRHSYRCNAQQTPHICTGVGRGYVCFCHFLELPFLALRYVFVRCKLNSGYSRML